MLLNNTKVVKVKIKSILFIILITIIFIAFMSCSVLAVVNRTPCTINKPAKLALIVTYESRLHRNVTFKGYKREDLSEITNELENLGFDTIYINPELNEYISEIMEVSKDYKTRANMILSKFECDFDYILYMHLKSLGDVGPDRKHQTEMTVVTVNTDMESIEDESLRELYSSYFKKSKLLGFYPKLPSSREYQLDTLEVSLYDIYNYLNKYVKQIRNYELILEEEEPICFNFVNFSKVNFVS